jgi:hypothetical protein
VIMDVAVTGRTLEISATVTDPCGVKPQSVIQLEPSLSGGLTQRSTYPCWSTGCSIDSLAAGDYRTSFCVDDEVGNTTC